MPILDTKGLLPEDREVWQCCRRGRGEHTKLVPKAPRMASKKLVKGLAKERGTGEGVEKSPWLTVENCLVSSCFE